MNLGKFFTHFDKFVISWKRVAEVNRLVYFNELLFCSSTIWNAMVVTRNASCLILPLPGHSMYGTWCMYRYEFAYIYLEISVFAGKYTICWGIGLRFARNFQHGFDFAVKRFNYGFFIAENLRQKGFRSTKCCSSFFVKTTETRHNN